MLNLLCLALVWPLAHPTLRYVHARTGEPYGRIARRITAEALRITWRDLTTL